MAKRKKEKPVVDIKSDEEKGKKIVPLREKVFYTFLTLKIGRASCRERV